MREHGRLFGANQRVGKTTGCELSLEPSVLHLQHPRKRQAAEYSRVESAVISSFSSPKGGQNRASRLNFGVWTFLRQAVFNAAGDFMASQVQLNDEDVTYLLTVLRNSSQPITTQHLINALRDRAK
jgi:hypothetical protein